MQIGYARVSLEEQNLALQKDALANAGCGRIFYDDGISGATAIRPALDEALSALAPGDVLITWKLDRLGRSLRHLMDVIEWLAKRRIGFRSLSEGIDSTTSTGMLLFHIVGAIAEFERTLISDRTRAGMASAKSRGASIGRPRKLSAAAVLEAKIALDAGTATLPDLAAALEVAPITLERALKGLDRAA